MKKRILGIALFILGTFCLSHAQPDIYEGLTDDIRYELWVDTFGYASKLYWPLQSKLNDPIFFKGVVENGCYTMLGEREGIAKLKHLNLNHYGDFEIEGSVLLLDKINGWYGICFGTNDIGYLNSFLINNQGEFKILRVSQLVNFIDEAPPTRSIHVSKLFNKLSIRKYNGYFYFFINENLVHSCLSFETSGEIGFLSGAGQRVRCDNFNVFILEDCVDDMEVLIERGALFASDILASKSLTNIATAQKPTYAEIGDTHGQVAVKICTNNLYFEGELPFKLTITSSDNSIITESVMMGWLNSETKIVELKPQLRWRDNELLKLTSPKSVSFTFNFEINDQHFFETVNTTIFPTNILPTYTINRRTGIAEAATLSVVAAVNEYDAAIKEIVSSVEKNWPNTLTTNFDKAAAIYAELQNTELGYGNHTIGGNTTNTSYQSFKNPSELFLSSVGNCLDISLCFASALKRAGVPSFLILYKNHVQPAFKDTDGKIYSIEITRIGIPPNKLEIIDFDEEMKEGRIFLKSKKGSLTKKQYKSYLHFKVNSTELRADALNYAMGELISIDGLRSQGVQPFSSQE